MHSNRRPQQLYAHGVRPVSGGHSTLTGGHQTTEPAQRFFVAAEQCLKPAPLPHPIAGRNADLVPAWVAWTGRSTSAHGVVAIHESLDPDMLLGDCRRRFSDNANVVGQLIKANPYWRAVAASAPPGSKPDTGADFVTAALMFWRRPRYLIELTPALQTMLARSDLGDDIPVSVLTAPCPASYVRFGEGFDMSGLLPKQGQHAFSRLDGAYVFEEFNNGRRSLAIIAIYEIHGHSMLGVSGMTLHIDDENEPLSEVIRRISARESSDHQQHHQALARACAKVFLYWTLDPISRVELTPFSERIEQLARLGPKKAAKLRRRVGETYDRIVLGPASEATNEPGRVSGPVTLHMRRGHFRMQPYGPMHSLRKLVFISPMLVGGG